MREADLQEMDRSFGGVDQFLERALERGNTGLAVKRRSGAQMPDGFRQPPPSLPAP